MMTQEDVTRLAAMAGLAIDPAYLAGVTAALETLLGQGGLLMAPPLAAEVEPAEAFRP